QHAALCVRAVDVLHDDRHALQACATRGAPATFARDDAEPVAVAPDDDRLDDAVSADRGGKLLELRVIHVRARLEIVRHELIDLELRRVRRTRRVGQIRNQGAQALAECGALLHVVITCGRPRADRADGLLCAGATSPCASVDQPAGDGIVAALRARTSRARLRYAAAP